MILLISDDRSRYGEKKEILRAKSNDVGSLIAGSDAMEIQNQMQMWQ